MNNERDELANIIKPAAAYDYWPQKAAELALAAGYRKHRQVTTLEELDALSLPAIIDSPSGGPAKVEYYAGPGRQKYVEPLFLDDDGGQDVFSLKFFAKFGLPATVLHVGGDD